MTDLELHTKDDAPPRSLKASKPRRTRALLLALLALVTVGIPVYLFHGKPLGPQSELASIMSTLLSAVVLAANLLRKAWQDLSVPPNGLADVGNISQQRARRVFPIGRRWTWIVVAFVAALFMFSLGYALAALHTSADRLSVRIDSPRDNGAYTAPIPDGSVPMEIIYSVSDIPKGFCAKNSVWLVDEQPSGRDGQPLFVARRELACRASNHAPIVIMIWPYDYHTFYIVAAPPDCTTWMQRNLKANEERDYSHDGEWTRLDANCQPVAFSTVHRTSPS